MYAEHYIQLVARDAVLSHGYRIDKIGVMHVYNEEGQYEMTKVMLASRFSEVWITFQIPYAVEENWNPEIAHKVKHEIERLLDTVIINAERQT